jgi:hypothetical protein
MLAFQKSKESDSGIELRPSQTGLGSERISICASVEVSTTVKRLAKTASTRLVLLSIWFCAEILPMLPTNSGEANNPLIVGKVRKRQ